jgi:hypothetical protein
MLFNGFRVEVDFYSGGFTLDSNGFLHFLVRQQASAGRAVYPKTKLFGLKRAPYSCTQCGHGGSSSGVAESRCWKSTVQPVKRGGAWPWSVQREEESMVQSKSSAAGRARGGAWPW